MNIKANKTKNCTSVIAQPEVVSNSGSLTLMQLSAYDSDAITDHTTASRSRKNSASTDTIEIETPPSAGRRISHEFKFGFNNMKTQSEMNQSANGLSLSDPFGNETDDDLECGNLHTYKRELAAKLIDTPVPAPAKADELQDNPRLGVLYYLAHTVLMSVSLYTGKLLFDLNPTVGIMQLTFSRGLIASLMLVVYLNRNLKAVLIDGVDRDSLPSLVVRCLQGGTSVFISFMCIKYFNVSTVGIVCSLTPIVVCVLAYYLLGERMTAASVAALVCVFGAVVLVIMGAEGEQANTMSANIWVTIALMFQPVLLASGAICMRSMRKMHESVVSTY